MDVFHFFVPDWLLWLGGVCLILYIYGTWPHGALRGTGLQGPPLRPFVGSILDMFTYPKAPGEYFLGLKKKYGPLIRLVDFRLPVIVMFDMDMIKAVTVKEHSSFTDRRTLPCRGIVANSLIDRNGETWKANRSLLTPFFTPGKLKRNFIDIKRACDNMIGHMRTACNEGKTVVAKVFSGSYAMDVICGTGFGLDVDSASNPNHPFIVHGNGLSQLTVFKPSIAISMIFPFVGKFLNWLGISMVQKSSVQFFSRVAADAIESRKHDTSVQHRPDFIDTMIRAHEEEMNAEILEESGKTDGKLEKMKRKGFTQDEIIANGIMLFLAGYDTTSTTLSFLMYTLAHHQDWQDKCAEEIMQTIGESEIDYNSVAMKKLECLDMCLQETQRLFPITFFIERVANKDITIGNLSIPKGTSCVIPVWAIHHDPDIWPDPENFDPQRFTDEAKKARNDYAYLPFGIGPRHCIGMRLALLEIKIGMVEILRNFKILRDDNSEFPPSLCSKIIFLKPEKELRVKLVPR